MGRFTVARDSSRSAVTAGDADNPQRSGRFPKTEGVCILLAVFRLATRLANLGDDGGDGKIAVFRLAECDEDVAVCRSRVGV